MSNGPILVTGAGGFVGSAVVRRLVRRESRGSGNEGAEHVVALLSPTSSAERLEDLAGLAAWSMERADIADRRALTALLDRIRPGTIVHVALSDAAFREVPVGDDDPLVAGPLATLMDGLRRAPAPRFVYAGSAWVLQSGMRLSESTPLDLRTPYARNKARADALIPVLAERAGVSWINLRLFNMFGRYEKPTRLVPTLVSRLARGEVAELTHGEQVRDFNDVDQMANAFNLAIRAPDEAWNALYHIGSGRGTSVREFALSVAETLGRPDLVRFGTARTLDEGLPSLVADPTLAMERIGWEPERDLATRMRRAVEWWLARLNAEVGR